MPSVSFFDSTLPRPNSIYTRPREKQKINITQTYFLAHSARSKLAREASLPDLNLRLLVGHANMLDTLMLDIANAEQEQEQWFNSIVKGSCDEKKVEFGETILEEIEEKGLGDKAEIAIVEIDLDINDKEELRLTRTPSRHSPTN